MRLFFLKRNILLNFQSETIQKYLFVGSLNRFVWSKIYDKVLILISKFFYLYESIVASQYENEGGYSVEVNWIVRDIPEFCRDYVPVWC